jgi:hypothetical protein
MWGALSLTRGRICRLQLLLVLASAVIFGSKSSGTHEHVLLPQIRDSPNLESQVPVFTSPRNRVAQLYPQALGSLCVAFFVSQGYGGGIRTRLHSGRPFKARWLLCISPALTYSKSTICPHSVFVLSIWFSQWTATVSANSINRLVFVMCFLSGTYWIPYIIYKKFSLWRHTLDEKPNIVIIDNPIFSSERMLGKDYDRKGSVEKNNLWLWVWRGSGPRRTD